MPTIPSMHNYLMTALMIAASATTLSAADIPGGSNVLVLANKGWHGANDQEIGESEKVARYYMKQRGVPEQNLLLVDIPHPDPRYEQFYNMVIVPVSQKLKQLRGDSQEDHILYILCCYGIPPTVYLPVANKAMTAPGDPKRRVFQDDGSVKLIEQNRFAIPRAADSFLCYPHLLAKIPVQEVPDAAMYDFGGVFDKYGFAPPTVHPYYGLAVKPGDHPDATRLAIGYAVSAQQERAMSFADARIKDPKQFAYYLVCRLDAPNPITARSLVDKAIYAETYLQNPTMPEASYKTECVFDLGEFGATNQQIQDAIDWFSGTTKDSPFQGSPWPMIVDTGTKSGEEIGIPDANGALYKPNDKNFVGRDLPITNALFYYGQYTTYGRYQDVYQWAVGAVGVHMDSGCCANIHAQEFDGFAKTNEPEDSKRVGFVPHALIRNMTASAGVVHEPFENGIIGANFLFRSLSMGFNFADACYTATRDIWWKSIFIGDPLYRPFGAVKKPDREPPVFTQHQLVINRTPETLTLVVNTDKPCQFQVKVGDQELRPFTRWGKTWEDRDWFYACEFTMTLPSSQVGKTDIVITARSPAGLLSSITERQQ